MRLGHLCGPLDEHLRRIENALGVTIAHRHEQFKVEGPKAIADQAMEVLQALYEIAERLGFLPGDLSQKVDPYLRPL